MPDNYSAPTLAQARNSIKSLHAEIANLTPSAMVTLFEIDISQLALDSNINLSTDAAEQGIQQGNIEEGVLRFHNNLKIFNSYIVWQGKTYYPAPITASGFETTTKGSLPQPMLTITANSENGIDQIALLKYEIRKIGDIVGSKVTRKRTFAKYLDLINFRNLSAPRSSQIPILPDGYEPDPYAYLPDDVFFIERKETENKSTLTYQLSSVLDMEGTKLPKRVLLADKCVWKYRGIGCWYQHPESSELKNYTSTTTPENVEIPILKKARLKTLKNDGIIKDSGGSDVTEDSSGREKLQACGMLLTSPPVATDSDDDIITEAQQNGTEDWNFDDLGVFNKNFSQSADNSKGYLPGNFVYVEKDSVKYYYVCKKAMNKNQIVAPPNTEYWVADQCSKSLTGCRLRWGARNKVLDRNRGGCQIQKGQLPYGGFPAAKKIARGG